MTELLITRGLPASGKTTFARAWVAEDCNHRVRVNRDDLRAMIYGKPSPLPWSHEKAISLAQRAQVTALLQAGTSVVVDDTHLRAKYARAWADLAVDLGVDFRVLDFGLDVEECIVRDLQRGRDGGRVVGEEAIRDMHARFRSRPTITPSPEVVPACAPYTPEPGAHPMAWIVDLDGTLALMGDRKPYDWKRVGEDAVNEPVRVVVDAVGYDHCIVLMSGRDEVCRPETEDWLRRHHIYYDALHMRPTGDTRRDDIVKGELFDTHVRNQWNVVGVLDDRDQVVRLWRSIGLPCLQVAEGAF